MKRERTPPLSKPNGKYKVIKALSEWHRIVFMKKSRTGHTLSYSTRFPYGPVHLLRIHFFNQNNINRNNNVFEAYPLCLNNYTESRILLDFQYYNFAVLCPSNFTLNLTYSGSFSKTNLEIGHFTLSIDTAA